MTSAPKMPPVTKEQIELVAQTWQMFARCSADIAHARRTLYLAYIAEGFTEVQALELVKTL